MSDPANDGYQCHGPMKQLSLFEITGSADTPHHAAAWLCVHRLQDGSVCGVWKHGYKREESQLRALVEFRMPGYIAALNGEI